jgi:hypothetical protein
MRARPNLLAIRRESERHYPSAVPSQHPTVHGPVLQCYCQDVNCATTDGLVVAIDSGSLKTWAKIVLVRPRCKCVAQCNAEDIFTKRMAAHKRVV